MTYRIRITAGPLRGQDATVTSIDGDYLGVTLAGGTECEIHSAHTVAWHECINCGTELPPGHSHLVPARYGIGAHFRCGYKT